MSIVLDVATRNLHKLEEVVDHQWAEVTSDICPPDSDNRNVQITWLRTVWDKLHTEGKWEPERIRQFFLVVSARLADLCSKAAEAAKKKGG